MEKEEEATNTARGRRRENTVWTDGSGLENKRVGAAFARRSLVSWSGCRSDLGTNKEASDAEVSAIYQALH